MLYNHAERIRNEMKLSDICHNNENINAKIHAFLILAHNDYELLEKLVALIDSFHADIYIHIDKKSKTLPNLKTKYSNLYFIKRIKTYWGGYSLVQCELNLLKASTKNSYQYYHLISGADLPLKGHDEFNNFFSNNCNNYITIESPIIDRVKLYNFFEDVKSSKLISIINQYLLKMQKILSIDRTKYIKKLGIDIYKGAQWFSITHDLALYVLSKEKLIRRLFKYTHIPDESFMQTITMNSSYKDTVTGNCLRFIDWSKHEPHPAIITMDYMDDLLNSDAFFARKFSTNEDNKIINELHKHILSST